MYRLLFVVHRSAPYAGGSEINIHRLAKEATRRGHDVVVLADTNQGDFDGVHITGDRNIAFQKWDMIIVHGSCPTQDFIHANAQIGKHSPVYYMLIDPPKYPIPIEHGLKNATWIGYGTSADYAFLTQHPAQLHKARPYVYGLPSTVKGTKNIIKPFLNVTTPFMMMSAGGYWPHKGFHELVSAFNVAELTDWTLVLFGYDTNHPIPTHGNERVMCVDGAQSHDIYNAMADADLYIMNSTAEGYGLTLLESMYNNTPWFARDIAAGHDLAQQNLGTVYTTYDELVILLRGLKDHVPINLAKSDEFYIKTNHTVEHSLDSILSVLS